MDVQKKLEAGSRTEFLCIHPFPTAVRKYLRLGVL
jgi:hypothetical protein